MSENPAPKPKLTPEQRAAKREKQQRERDDARLIHLTMMTRWPTVFNVDTPKPLEVGVYEQLRKHISNDISGIRLRRAIRHWTQSDAYKEALVRETHRFRLNGDKAEEISSEDKSHAQDALDRREHARKQKRKRLQQARDKKTKS